MLKENDDMTDTADATTGTPVLPIVRVAILADGRMADIALPTELPLREILPAIRRLLLAGGTEEWTTSDHVPCRLTLAPVGGAPFSPDANLDTVGVVDGDLLVLQQVPSGPAAPGIVEDVADAAVIYSRSRARQWGISHLQWLARGAVLALLLTATGLAVAYRLATGEAVGLFALSAIAAAAAVVALVLSARSGSPTVEFSVAALVPIGAVFALAVPGDFGPAQIMLGAAGVAAWSMICMIFAERCVAFFTATTIVGLGVLMASAVAQVWHLPMLTLGCGVLAAALLVAVQSAQLSALLARLPLPVIPAPGDPAPSAPALRVLADLPRRVQVGEAHQTGFIAGAVVLSVLGSLAIAGRPETLGGWAWYAVIATSAATVLRARVWDNVACKAWLLAQPFLLSVGLLVLFTATGRYLAAVTVLIAMALLTVGFVIAATNPRLVEPQSYSLPMRRAVGFVAAALDSSLVPVFAYLVGLFAWVLNR